MPAQELFDPWHRELGVRDRRRSQSPELRWRAVTERDPAEQPWIRQNERACGLTKDEAAAAVPLLLPAIGMVGMMKRRKA